MINVYVGAKCKKFHLHNGLLSDRSDFFRKALGGGFQEQDERAVYLPDEDVGAFELFVRWIYGAPLRAPSDLDSFTRHLALYVMAEKFCMEPLKNLLMDAIRTYYRFNGIRGGPEQMEYVYENTPADSSLRLFLVRAAAYGVVARINQELPKNFLELLKKGGDVAADFTSALLRSSAIRPRTTAPSMELDCAYHEHKSTKSCV